MDAYHKTALIHPKSEIGKNVRIGAYSIIEEGVYVGDETVILDHVHIGKGTTIGRNNTIHMGAIIGHEAQHRQASSEAGLLAIGDHNVFREYVTIHRGLEKESRTVIGHHNFFLAFAHAAHDCLIEDYVTIANNTLLGGYVTLEHHSFLSAMIGVHQFCRVGRYAMVGGYANVTKDVPPYMLVDNLKECVSSVNVVGLKRAGFSEEVRKDIKKAYRLLYLSGMVASDALKEIERTCLTEEAKYLTEFARKSKRGIMPHQKKTQPLKATEQTE